MLITIAVASSLALLVLFLWGRRDEARVRREWVRLLTAGGENVSGASSEQVRFERAMAEITCAESFAALEFGSLEDAKRLLDAGYEVIARFAPTLLKLVAAMAAFSRTISTVPFAAPLHPESFRLRGLTETAAQRYRFGVYTLGHSWGMIGRYLRAPSRRDARGPVPEPRALRVLLQMLLVQLSDDALWQLAERRGQWRQAPQTPAMRLWVPLIVVALTASVLLRQV